MDKNAITLQEKGNDGQSVFLYYDWAGFLRK